VKEKPAGRIVLDLEDHTGQSRRRRKGKKNIDKKRMALLLGKENGEQTPASGTTVPELISEGHRREKPLLEHEPAKARLPQREKRRKRTKG